MKNMLKKARKNNKGFTLVELIIVIAIIAVLSAVVAPQYIKYVENSRIATDRNAVEEIMHAAEIAAVGNGTTQPSGNVALDIAASGNGLTYTVGASGTLSYAVNEIVASGSYTLKSKAYQGWFAAGANALTISIDSNGKASLSTPLATIDAYTAS